MCVAIFCVYVYMFTVYGWMRGWVDGSGVIMDCVMLYTEVSCGGRKGWRDGGMDGWEGWMDGWGDGWMDNRDTHLHQPDDLPT